MILAWLSLALARPVEGVIVVQGGNATLPGATITLPDGSVVVTDGRGRFQVELPDVDAPSRKALDTLPKITIAGEGYLDEALPARPPARGRWVIALSPAPPENEIVIESFRPTGDLTRQPVDAEMAFETPGTYDDAVRLIQALPGVAVQREYSPTSGDLTVRGSLPGDNRYYVDGIEVPYLYHFNQYASVVPASSLDQLELFSSTFSAKYGDSAGAIVEASTRSDRPDHVAGNASLNFVMLGADVRIPVPNKRWWVSVSGRRSYQDLVGESSLQYPKWPTFYDASVRAQHDGTKGSTQIFFTGAGDAYARAVGELDVLDPVDQTRAPSLNYRHDFQILGVQHRWGLGRFVVGVVHDDERAAVSVGGRADVRSLVVASRLDARAPITDDISLEYGYEAKPEFTWIDVSSAGVYGPLVQREAPETSWETVFSATGTPRLRAGLYTQLNARIGRVRLMPGLRAGADLLGGSAAQAVGTLEPRFAMRARVADATELRLAAGRYQQRPETNVALALSRALPTTDSWQVGAGIEQTIYQRLEFGLEGFYKASSDVIVLPASGPPQVWDHGRAYGGEFVMRYRLREVFFLWAQVAAGRSLAIDADGRASPTQADQPIAGGVVASWNILPPLNVALRWRGASGLPYTAIVGSTYDATEDSWIPTFGALNGIRMPFYQKVDVHLAYTWTLPRWSLTASADVWIVPKPSAPIYPTWNYDFSEAGFVIGPVVLPLLGLRASW